MGFGSCYVEHCQLPPLDKDYTYLDDISGPVLEEEISNLAKYTRRALTAPFLDATSNWENFWYD